MAIVRTACTMTLDPKDLDEVVGIFESFIKDVQEKDYGVLAYHYFVDEDPLTIHVIEWYESPQAMLDHYANLNLEIGRASGAARQALSSALLRQPDAGGGGPDGRVRRGPHPPSAGEHPGDRRAGVVTRVDASGGIATGAGSGRGRAFCPCSDPLGRRS